MKGLPEGVRLVSGVGASDAARIAGLSSGASTWVSPDFNKPMELVDEIKTITISVPDDFGQQEALKRLARLIISQLETGMSERDIAKRLHGRIERETIG